MSSRRPCKQALLLGALLFSACSPEGGNPVQACITISGGGTQITTSSQPLCTGCSVSNGSSGIDGDKDSAAIAAFTDAGTGTITVRATAQEGVVFPAGSQAGALVAIDAAESRPFIGYYVDTYLEGVRMDRIHNTGGFVGSVSSGNFGTGCDRPCNSSRREITGSAPRPFDAIELGFARDASGVPQNVLVYEFCSGLQY